MGEKVGNILSFYQIRILAPYHPTLDNKNGIAGI